MGFAAQELSSALLCQEVGCTLQHRAFLPKSSPKSSILEKTFFSRMRGKGSRFTLGVWGLRVCSLDVAFMFPTVRNRSQRFATVRSRSQPFATVRVRPVYGLAYGKFCRRVAFGGCTCRVASFRVADVALRDIQTCFVTRRKSFCVAGAILLRRFQIDPRSPFNLGCGPRFSVFSPKPDLKNLEG